MHGTVLLMNTQNKSQTLGMRKVRVAFGPTLRRDKKKIQDGIHDPRKKATKGKALNRLMASSDMQAGMSPKLKGKKSSAVVTSFKKKKKRKCIDEAPQKKKTGV